MLRRLDALVGEWDMQASIGGQPIRGVLLHSFREAKARLGDPVAAWADITGDPERARR